MISGLKFIKSASIKGFAHFILIAMSIVQTEFGEAEKSQNAQKSSGGEDNNTATYCKADETLYTKACTGNYKCMRCEDGYVGCTDKEHDDYCNKSGDEDYTVLCSGDKLTTGGVAGNCCDMKNYMPAWGADNKSITYCNSKGKIKICNTTACGNIESNAKYDRK